MGFVSVKEMLELSNEKQKEIWELVYEDDYNERNVSRQNSWEKMRGMWYAMKASSENYDGKIRSHSGLSGGNGLKMREYGEKCISGSFMGSVMAEAISVAESNACMKCIVAAPTAGSCGVLPAVLIPYVKKYNTEEDKIIKGLYTSAAFGQIIAQRAFIAGAAGGCQAEIGSASAMAAAMLVYLQGGSGEQSANAMAFALKSLLGLVCDPVAGLVEVPCVKRNVIGAVNAVTSADMAMAGIKSVIPPDEVIDAMREVGLSMPAALRETGEGGLAATPTGVRIAENMPKLGDM
ncbi:MAG: L-serine ammonia-lyase, iron-sulfur-dependent, subunit alpha [Clostridia bacterium]|nr:L-serine ammonia-lyase, iron-sulfur-dependent, subunit alpha [Clostridia bacterium]